MYINKDNKCEYHCGLIASAYFRANQWKHKNPKYKDVANKARELFIDNNCSTKIKIHILDENNVLKENEADLNNTVDVITFIESSIL